MEKITNITFRPRQNGCHIADDIFKCIFLTENIRISIKISPKFVRKGPINNILALVKIMAWHRPGDKPSSEPMMVRLPIYASLGLNEIYTIVNNTWLKNQTQFFHYVIMSAMVSQITSLTIITQPFIQGTDQRKHQSSASLAFVREIHRLPVNSPHKAPVTRKMFPFDEVIMS